MNAEFKPNPRTILITGATGFIGQYICRTAHAAGDHLIVLSRDPKKARNRLSAAIQIVTNVDQIDRAQHIDVVINLAGAPIAGWFWTRARRQLLLDSRVQTTQAIVDLIERLEKKPNLLVSASAIGYYGIHGERRLIESDKAGSIFQSRLCEQWEKTARQAERFGTRVCLLRLGLVLGRGGGVLSMLMLPLMVRSQFLFGSGNQWVSWIHIEDVARLIKFAIETDALRGPVNGTTSRPVNHKELMVEIAKRRRPLFKIKIPAAVLRWTLGEVAQLFVDGQKVAPISAPALGFKYRFEKLNRALDDLLSKHSVRKSVEDYLATTIFKRPRGSQ